MAAGAAYQRTELLEPNAYSSPPLKQDQRSSPRHPYHPVILHDIKDLKRWSTILTQTCGSSSKAYHDLKETGRRLLRERETPLDWSDAQWHVKPETQAWATYLSIMRDMDVEWEINHPNASLHGSQDGLRLGVVVEQYHSQFQ